MASPAADDALANKFVRAVLSNGGMLFDFLLMVQNDEIAQYHHDAYEMTDDFSWIEEDLKAQWDVMMEGVGT